MKRSSKNSKKLLDIQSYGILAIDFLFSDKEITLKFLNSLQFLLLFDEEEAEEKALEIIGDDYLKYR